MQLPKRRSGLEGQGQVRFRELKNYLSADQAHRPHPLRNGRRGGTRFDLGYAAYGVRLYEAWRLAETLEEGGLSAFAGLQCGGMNRKTHSQWRPVAKHLPPSSTIRSALAIRSLRKIETLGIRAPHYECLRALMCAGEQGDFRTAEEFHAGA